MLNVDIASTYYKWACKTFLGLPTLNYKLWNNNKNNMSYFVKTSTLAIIQTWNTKKKKYAIQIFLSV